MTTKGKGRKNQIQRLPHPSYTTTKDGAPAKSTSGKGEFKADYFAKPADAEAAEGEAPDRRCETQSVARLAASTAP